jgi:hypothetical protein
VLHLDRSVFYEHLTRLERLNRNKRSSLLQKFVNYCRKKFHNVETSSSSVSFQSIQRAMPEIMDKLRLTTLELAANVQCAFAAMKRNGLA